MTDVQYFLCFKQPQLMEHSVIFLKDNAAPHHHHDVQSLAQAWGKSPQPTLLLLLVLYFTWIKELHYAI
jgi:hypothetical protein